ncbi:MAG: Glu-tRNA(Gln) amidotransferase subunit GatE [Nitrospinota bacterium]
MPILDYEALGFRSGLEVHYQLLTDRKLFCRCPAGQYSTDFDVEILRHMRPTLSELGEYDGTALMEFKTRKEVIYQIRNDFVCTYEMDDTPPFPPDPKAVEIALEVALLLGCSIVGEIHITRKQYLDGSIPTGFQRTALVGVEGRIPLDTREIPIIQVGFEEDSCREVRDEAHRITFRTDRLGMPLVEVVTHPEMRNPKEVMEVGRRIGQILQATGKVRRGIGSVRQDVNVSINGAPRVEIKGVPRIPAFERLTHNEARRQKGLLEIKEHLEHRGIAKDKVFVQSAPMPTGIIGHAVLDKCQADGIPVWAVRVEGFAKTLAWPLQETLNGDAVPFLREIAGRIRVIACLDEPPILFCREAADPKYPGQLDPKAWEVAADMTGAEPSDALMIIWGPEPDLLTAVQEIEIRCQEATEEIPRDTRQALDDGTTDFERVLAGPDRMYPDTDLPLLPIEEEHVAQLEAALPEPPWERETRYLAWGLPPDVIEVLISSTRGALLDRIVNRTGASPLLVGTVLVHDWKALARKGVNPVSLSGDRWVELFQAHQNRRFGREAIPQLLEKLSRSSGMTLDAIFESSCLIPMTEDALHQIVDEVISTHGNDLMHNPTEENRIRRLMGIVMKRAGGSRNGREVCKVLEQRWKESGSGGAAAPTSRNG